MFFKLWSRRLKEEQVRGDLIQKQRQKETDDLEEKIKKEESLLKQKLHDLILKDWKDNKPDLIYLFISKECTELEQDILSPQLYNHPSSKTVIRAIIFLAHKYEIPIAVNTEYFSTGFLYKNKASIISPSRIITNLLISDEHYEIFWVKPWRDQSCKDYPYLYYQLSGTKHDLLNFDFNKGQIIKANDLYGPIISKEEEE